MPVPPGAATPEDTPQAQLQRSSPRPLARTVGSEPTDEYTPTPRQTMTALADHNGHRIASSSIRTTPPTRLPPRAQSRLPRHRRLHPRSPGTRAPRPESARATLRGSSTAQRGRLSKTHVDARRRAARRSSFPPAHSELRNPLSDHLLPRRIGRRTPSSVLSALGLPRGHLRRAPETPHTGSRAGHPQGRL